MTTATGDGAATADLRVVACYLDDVSGGAGRLAPRAEVRSDAPVLVLDGPWRFHLADSVARAPLDAGSVTLDDSAWPELHVPSHWQLEGFGAPAYTNRRYLFPVDPPRVPDENPTADYRRWVEVPESWRGHRVALRFDGVDSCFRVEVNGHEVGWSAGSRLPAEFDVTERLRPGEPNLVAVRVHQWSAGSYLEAQDTWWLSGVFRTVQLRMRPAGGLEDVVVHADYDRSTGRGTLRVEGTAGARVVVAELGIDQPTGATAEVAVEPWSAEVPRLYDAEVSRGGETARLRLGFRRVSIEDGVLLVNGRPVLLHGVNRHEFHPDRGRSLTLQDMVDDVVLMKRHNIDAVRTSHYPPHPDFLALCDEYGLYLMDECDLETHGFEEVGWEANPTDDPVWRQALVDRMHRMMARDRNHPSVIMWSLGNESHHGCNLEAMYRFAKELDPTRPVHYEHDKLCGRHSDVFSQMYTPHRDVDMFGRRAEPPGSDDPVQEARRRSAPFLLCEYAHAMGTGPGGLREYQDLFGRHERCAGGFVWEWIDQGLRTTDDLGRSYFGYGGDFGEVLHDGRFICDGLVYPDRTPSSGLVELKAVFAPIRFRFDHSSRELEIRSLRLFRDTADLRWRCVVEHEGHRLLDHVLDVAPIGPGGCAAVPLYDLPDAPGAVLTVSAELAAAASWAPTGHEIAFAQWTLSPPEPVRVTTTAQAVRPDPSDRLRLGLGTAVFDRVTGRLRRLGAVGLAGPVLDVWRAPTDNDMGIYDGLIRRAVQWREAGLDRLEHRLDGLRHGDDGGLVATVRSGPASVSLGCVTTWSWHAGSEPGSVVLDLDIVPQRPWPFAVGRIGLAFELDPEYDRVQWDGLGPGESYPDMRQGVRWARHELTVDELQAPLVRPQENGHRSAVTRLRLGSAAGQALLVRSDTPFGFTARRWTSRDLDGVRHSHELEDRGRVFLTLDLAVLGLGSASAGPHELPQYTLELTPRTARFVFSAGP